MPLLKRILKGEKMGFRELSSAKQAIYLLQKGKPSPARKKASGVRKQEKRANHREETARIRDAVFARADGKCENCFKTDLHLQLDHWLGGSGRRVQRQSLASTWAVCASCHFARTDNMPDAAYWNDRFERHCFKHGYFFHPHAEHAPVKKQGNAPQAQELVIPEVPHD